MHVLILPSWYPRFDGDAEGSFFRDQTHGLAEAGLKVGVVFSDLRGPGRHFQKGRPSGITIAQDGPIAEVRSHGFNWSPRFMPGFEWLWLRHAERALSVYLDRFGKTDVVHVHSMEPAATMAARLKDRYGIPFVITEHSTFHLRHVVSDGVRRKCARLAQASSANLAVSEVFAGKLDALYGGDWSYLPNIVSSDFLRQPLISLGDREFRLVSVALLSRRKRMDLVVEAVAALRARGHDVALTIVGDGEERPRLEQMVSALGLEEKIEFAGLTARADVPGAMSKGRILVSASEAETFGVTLIEGMALGMPIVATRSGGPDSIVTPEVGKLVDDWSAAAIADAIEEVIRHIDRYDPAKMRAHCEARYSTSVVSDALKSIYADAIADAS